MIGGFNRYAATVLAGYNHLHQAETLRKLARKQPLHSMLFEAQTRKTEQVYIDLPKPEICSFLKPLFFQGLVA